MIFFPEAVSVTILEALSFLFLLILCTILSWFETQFYTLLRVFFYSSDREIIFVGLGGVFRILLPY